MTSILALTSTSDRGEDLTIDATLDPDIAMFVTSSAVTSVENPRIRLIEKARQHIHEFPDDKHTFM